MRLKRLEIIGFKSFARKSVFEFNTAVSSIVGPNGSGKSNVAEAIRFVLGEQSMKSLRGKRGEDLIWNGSGNMARSNHASVAIAFDNSKKEFELDYDEVEIKRHVFRDGTNQYFINGTQVRLRDILELLAKVHIGATGHHIISQGEADRILNANIKERRTMVEEALGLKIYQWKIEESEKKLGKTEENIKQVESLRREIAPHIRFLKKQVEKIEKAKEMSEELKGLYAEYLKREEVYVKTEKKRIEVEKNGPVAQLRGIEEKLEKARAAILSSDSRDPKEDDLMKLESEISFARKEKDDASRQEGRLEGMIEFEEKRILKARNREVQAELVPYKDVRTFTNEVEELLLEGERGSTLEEMKIVFVKARRALGDFLSRIRNIGSAEDHTETSELLAIKDEKRKMEERLSTATKHSDLLAARYEELKREIEREKDSSRETERAVFEMMAKKSELTALVSRLSDKEEELEKAERMFKEEIKEGIVLVGRDITLYGDFAVSESVVMSEPRETQEGRRRAIERIKIKLEEQGVGGSDETMKEYQDATERDSFLEREITDLYQSAESLRALIVELNEKLDMDFKEGIVKINKQFQEFFALMFGGGAASLFVIAQKKRKRKDTDIPLGDDGAIVEVLEEETEEGIDINVSLPRKKIKGLQMLSGGERALTSIALIFAVSQVNPPPFLVLDETDAALDEANSRRYGDMLENLSKHSQLIVITHNRETMSRADLLYGITMGSDAVSRLLSVRFDEASQFAK
ncbi:MAG: AAA family ATPase, partial [Patescibacteria group bacterium]